MIIHEIFRVLLRSPRYVSCYIADNGLPLGQCMYTVLLMLNCTALYCCTVESLMLNCTALYCCTVDAELYCTVLLYCCTIVNSTIDYLDEIFGPSDVHSPSILFFKVKLTFMHPGPLKMSH